MFAVIKTGGKQYKVVANDLIKIEKLSGEPTDMVEFTQVLMVGEGSDITVGAPIIANAVVKATIVKQARARKVIAFKKRRRKNSQRTRGHRQSFTMIRVNEITVGGKKAKVSAE